MKSMLAAAAAALLTFAAAPANAVVVFPFQFGLDAFPDSAATSVFRFDLTSFGFIDLPTNFTNALLIIDELSFTDRGVLRLNGVDIDAAGVVPRGAIHDGFFDDGSGNLPYTYVRGNGAREVIVNSGFVAGPNQLEVIINSTGQGIFGEPIGGPDAQITLPIRASLHAQLRYDLLPVAPGGVPEPATWGLMILGFGAAGGVLRNSRRRRALA